MTPIRILVADDHAVLRSGLRLLLETQRDLTVVGEAGDGRGAVRATRELKPDVVLLDISMPGPRSGRVIRDVIRASPKTRVLVLTVHDDVSYLRASLSAGATGYVVKKVADHELLSAIRSVYAGRTFVDLTQTPSLGRRSVPAPADGEPQQPKQLSHREREVLRLLAQGHSNQQVASQMLLSVKTVETYRTRLSEKLGLKGRAQLYRFAAESGILDAEVVLPGRRGRK